MPKSVDDRKYMRRALALARKGGAKVFPNPQVGCVIVNEGRIVGEGYHEYFGGPHAEINALNNAGAKAHGSVMFVTLEPCSHHGKTPPCTDAILRAGVRRVVVAMTDPDGKARGQGLTVLRKHGVHVHNGLLERKSRELNKNYVHSRATMKAEVIVKAAMSVDGKIATRTGDSKWISSARARAFVHGLRSRVDAIVVGINTVVRDNPSLTSHGHGPNPVRVIVDPKLRLPMNSHVLDPAAPTLVVCGNQASAGRKQALQEKGALVVTLALRKGKLDFRDIVQKLRQYSLNRILIEGGGETLATALDSGVATDALFFIAPILIGGRDAITAVEGNGIDRVAKALRLRHPRITQIGPDFMLRAKI